MLYDACCNLLIEEVALAAQDDITREAARAGLFTRMRFSPGNGDLPLTIQPQPIKAIAAKYGCCVIGLRLTEKAFRLTAQERFRTVLQRAIGNAHGPIMHCRYRASFSLLAPLLPKGFVGNRRSLSGYRRCRADSPKPIPVARTDSPLQPSKP